jgi:hypothetical protein
MDKVPNNGERLAVSIGSKSEFDTILARPAAISADRSDRTPSDISWSDVGT